MKNSEKLCIKIQIRSEKHRGLYRKREANHIQGTPKIILGKAQSSIQQIWIDELRNQKITKLKEYNNTQRAHSYAKTIVSACCEMASNYGFFIINENMIFFDRLGDIFAWINPDVCENTVKIYLPHTHQGELAMIRSIIAYLKLWFKCQYFLLNDVKNLNQLSYEIENMKVRPNQTNPAFSNPTISSIQRDLLLNRKHSLNLQPGDLAQRYQTESEDSLLVDNKSMRDQMGRSSGKEQEKPNYITSSLSAKMQSPLKFTYPSSKNKQGRKNRTTLVSQKNEQDSAYSANSQFEHRIFNNSNPGNNTSLNKSVGIKLESPFYPNKTTSNKNNKHHIVALIKQQDKNPHEYSKNKILLEQYKMQESEKERLRRGMESLDGIGQEINDLFLSYIQNEEENQDSLKNIEKQISALLQ